MWYVKPREVVPLEGKFKKNMSYRVSNKVLNRILITQPVNLDLNILVSLKTFTFEPFSFDLSIYT